MASHELDTRDAWLTARIDLLECAPLGCDEGALSWSRRHEQYPATTAGPS